MSEEADPVELSEEEGRCSVEDPDCEPDWLAEAELVSEPPPLAPARLLPVRGTGEERALAGCYNRIGGALQRLAAEYEVPVAVALAVWMTESYGRPHVVGQALIRFENHKFWAAWGKAHPKEYGQHWQHQRVAPDGDRVKPWKDHKFRTGSDAWLPSHTDGASGQRVEYAALALAIALAGEELALPCISIGGCQILVKHWKMLGYDCARAMFDGFQSSEEAQCRGLFVFCAHEKIVDEMQRGDFIKFADVYNGDGKVYGPKIAARTHLAETLLTLNGSGDGAR